jgi:hypothetical protein
MLTPNGAGAAGQTKSAEEAQVRPRSARTEMAKLLVEMIAGFRADCERAETRGTKVPWEFRLQWDGDFFSLAYAHVWANVVRTNPDIRFWVYTRSVDPGPSTSCRLLRGWSICPCICPWTATISARPRARGGASLGPLGIAC